MGKVYKNNACRIRFEITSRYKNRRYKKILYEIQSKNHALGNSVFVIFVHQPIKCIFTSANRAGQFGE